MPERITPPSRSARPRSRGLRPAALALALAAAYGALSTAAHAQTLPSGGVAVHGQAVITQPSANHLQVVTQNGAGTQHSAINWQSFSISAGSTATIVQPGASSLSINRVVTNTPSAIFGNLQSNGRLVLVNQSGIAVGAGAVIDTAGFTASALRMTDADALAGRLRFGEPGAAMGGAAGLTVGGRITARDGDIVLVAPNIDLGTSALLKAPNGSTILAAGQQVEITGRGLEGITMLVQAPADQARNLGRLEGNAVGIFAGTLRHSGEIQATTATLEGGTVVLRAGGDALVEGAGVVVATGTKGGRVDVLGDRVAIADQSRIDVSGTQGGGSIRVGGDYLGRNAELPNARYTHVGVDTALLANATEAGDGGRVIVWADDVTRAQGQISANAANGGGGGFVETSGARYLDVGGIRVTASGSAERPGTWLLDPADITITHGAATGPYPSGNKDQFQQNLGAGSQNFFFPVPSASVSTLTDGDLNAFLNSGTNLGVILQTSNSPEGAGFGDITFDGTTGGAIVIGRTNNVNTNANTLAFNANRNIVFGSGTTTFQRNGAATGLPLTVQLNPGTTDVSGRVLTSAGATVVLDGVNDVLNVDVKNGKVWDNFGTITMNGQSVIRLPDESGYATFANRATGVVNVNTSGTWSFLSDSNPQGGILNNAGIINVNGVAAGNTTSWEVLYTNQAGGTLHLGAGKLLSMQNAGTLGGSLVLDSGSELRLSQQFLGTPNVANATFSGTGKLSVSSGVSVDFSNNSGTLGALEVGGTVGNLAGTLTVGGFSQSGGSFGGSGNLTVVDSFSRTGGLFEPSGALTITQASGNLVFDESANLTALALNAPTGTLSIEGALTVGTTLTLAAGGSITQTGGSLVVGGATVLNAPGSAVDLSVGSNDFLSITGFTGALTVVDINSLEVGAADITSNNGNVTLSATGIGNMTLLGDIIAGSGNVTLNSRAVTQSDGAITGAVLAVNSSLGSVALGGDNNVTAARLSGSGASTITFNNTNADYALSGTGGTLTVTGPGQVTVDQPLTFASGINISSATGITLSANVTPGADLALTSTSGLIEQIGASTLFANSGTATINAGSGDISLVSATNQFNVVNLVGGHITVVGSNGLIVNSMANGLNRNVFLDAGAGDLLLPATPINAGTGQITLTSGGDLFLGGALTGSDILLSASTGLTIDDNITASGFLNMGSTSGGVTQSIGSAIVVTGITSVGAGIAAIFLNEAGNNFSTIEADGGVITLRDANALNLGAINASTSLSVQANGNVTQSAPVVVSGTTAVSAGAGNVILTTAGNNLNLLDVSGNAINVAEGAGSNLTITSLTSGINQPVSLSAGHTLTLPGTAINTGTADLTLSSAIGPLTIPAALNGNNISLGAVTGATVNAPITASGDFSATVTGGGSTLTVNRLVSAGADMTLNLVGNLSVLASAGIAAGMTAVGDQTITAGGNILLQGAASGFESRADLATTGSAGTQSVTANGITLLGGNGSGNSASIKAAGFQQVTVGNGGITMTGGGGSLGNNYAEIEHLGPVGTHQLITVNGTGSITLLAGSALGGDSEAAIRSEFGDSQTITFTGLGGGRAITLTGGSVGSNSYAEIWAGVGTQLVNGAGLITLTGGASGGGASFDDGDTLGNLAAIGADSNDQTIFADGIVLQGGVAGLNNFAALFGGGDQSITIGSGGLLLAGGGGGGSDLKNAALIWKGSDVPGTSQTLTIGGSGSVTLQGGSASRSNVGLDIDFGNLSNGAFAAIRSEGGAQLIEFTAPGGSIQMTGGTVGSDNHAMIFAANGAQTIRGISAAEAPDLSLSGGASGGVGGAANEGNRAMIFSQVGNQTITASAISLAGGSAGNDNLAQIRQGDAGNGLASTQTVSVVGGGDITLQGGAGNANFARIRAFGTTQTVSFSSGGTIDATGGFGGLDSFAQIIAHNGDQFVTGATAISLAGGSGGTNNRAQITAPLGSQTLSVGSGGLSLTGGSGGVGELSNFASVFQGGTTGDSQTILVGGGGDITLAGGDSAGTGVGLDNGSLAYITNQGDSQLIEFSGAGSTLGITGGTGGSRNEAGILALFGSQTIRGTTAGNAPAIVLEGGADGGLAGEPNLAQIAVNAGAQFITARSIALSGGGADGTDNIARIRQGTPSSGLASNQSITITSGGAFSLQGGSGDVALADVRAHGPLQTIDFSAGGSLSLTGGTGPSLSYARIESVNGNQTLSGAPNITLNGGASGGASLNGNFASIQAGGPSAVQNITSSAMTLNAGASGVNNFAFVGAANQFITVNGNLALNGGGSAGSLDGTLGGGTRIGAPGSMATDLLLNVTGNLTLTGGSLSGSAIGAGVAGGSATDLDITVGGNVSLLPGSIPGAGARIGSPSALLGGGNIVVDAFGSISLGTIGGGDTGVFTAGDILLEGNTLAIADAVRGNRVELYGVSGVSLSGFAAIAAAGTGDALIVRVDSGPFSNTASANPLSAPNGRWLVYSVNPANDVRGTLVHDFKQYDTVSGETVLGSGNGLLYSLASPSATATLVGLVSKTYDGTVGAILSPANYSATGIDGDVIVLNNPTVGTYDTKAIGSGKQVIAGGLSIVSVVDSASRPVFGYNPTVSPAGGLVGEITAATITGITGITVQEKVYDSTTAATLVTSLAQFDGMAAGDALTVGSGTGTFDTKTVGTGKPVAVTGLSLSGPDAGNYLLGSTTASATGTITPASISAVTGITAANKVYDGDTGAILTTSGAAFTGRLGLDVLTVATATGNFSDKNVGNPKAVNITGLSLGGADAINYTLGSTTATTAAAIAPATITAVGGITATKAYDGTTSATVVASGATFTGAVAGDTLSVTASSASFADRNAGTGKALTASGLTLGGGDAGNYTMVASEATGFGTITQRALSTWSGAAGDGLWSNPLNWDALPDGSNVAAVSIPAGAGSVSFDSGVVPTSLQSVSSLRPLAINSGSLSVSIALATEDFSQSGGTLGGTGDLTVLNSFSQTGGSIAMGSLTIVENSGNLAFTSLTGTTVALVAPQGSISQSGPLVATTLTTTSDTGTVLMNPGNQISNLLAVNTGTGLIAISNTVPMNVLGLDNAGGDIQLSTFGALSTFAPVTSATGSVSLAALGSGGDLGLFAPVSAGDLVVLDAGNSLLQDAAVVGANGVTADAGLSITLGPLATANFSPVVYRLGGNAFASPPTGLVSGSGLGAAEQAPVDALVTFVALLTAAVNADAVPEAEDFDPDGTRKKRSDDTIVTEGEVCN